MGRALGVLVWLAGCGGKTGLVDVDVAPAGDGDADTDADSDAASDADADADADADGDADCNATWAIQGVESEHRSRQPRIALGAGTAIHVAYQSSSDELYLATRSDEEGIWEHEVVDAASGPSVAIAADGEGRLHVVYSTAGWLQIAQGFPGDWVTSVVSTEAAVGDIVFDPVGGMNVTFASNSGGYLFTFIDGQWVHSTVADQTKALWYVLDPRLAYRSDGVGFVSWMRVLEGGVRQVRVSSNETGIWDHWDERPADESGTMRTAAVAVDADDSLVLCAVGDEVVSCGPFDSTGWHPETVDTVGGRRIAVRATRAATHVLYATAGDTGELRYATNRTGTWEVETIDRDRERAGQEGVDLVLDARGLAHAVYAVPGDGPERNDFDIYYAEQRCP